MKRPIFSTSPQTANDRKRREEEEEEKTRTVALRTNYTTLTSSVSEPTLSDGFKSSRITISLERVPDEIKKAKRVEMILSKMSIPVAGIPLVQIPIKQEMAYTQQNMVVTTYGKYFPVFYYFPAGNPIAKPVITGYSTNTSVIEETILLQNGGEFEEALANGSCSIHNASELASCISVMLKNCVLANLARWNTDVPGLTNITDYIEVNTGINADSISINFILKGNRLKRCPFFILGGSAPIDGTKIINYTFNDSTDNPLYGEAVMLLCVNKAIKERYPFLNWIDAYKAGISHIDIAEPDQYYVWNSQDLVATRTASYESGTYSYTIEIPSSNIANSACFCGLTIQCPSFPMTPQNYPVYYKNPLSTSVATQNLTTITEPILEIYIPLVGKASDLDGYLVVNKDNLSTAGPIQVDPKMISSLSNFFFEFKWIDNWGQLHDLHIPTNQNIFIQLTWFLYMEE